MKQDPMMDDFLGFDLAKFYEEAKLLKNDELTDKVTELILSLEDEFISKTCVVAINELIFNNDEPDTHVRISARIVTVVKLMSFKNFDNATDVMHNTIIQSFVSDMVGDVAQRVVGEMFSGHEEPSGTLH